MDYRNARHATFADLGPQTSGFAYGDLDVDDYDYYSTTNPRYGVTESFAPPRSFSPAPENRRGASRPGVRSAGSAASQPRQASRSVAPARSYAREPLRVSDKLKSFGCIALALVVLLLIGGGLLRASGQTAPFPFLQNSTVAPVSGNATNTFQAALNEASSQSNSDESPTSTPASQWARGTMPHLYQKDAAWANTPYAGSTIGIAGCGPTCMSMVYIYLTGDTSYDPVAMAQFSEANGFVEDGSTRWVFMSEGARQLGLQSEELGADPQQIASSLEAGNPVIAILGPGDFTEEGHFIVMHGLDSQGRAVVYDPNSPTRSSTPWEIDTIIGQALCFWRLSV